MQTKLILGGHSFITQLGNDPAASEGDMREIVAQCLAHGITTFDTTYLPERIALGRILEQLNARSNAQIIAWNFFENFGPSDPVGTHAAYQPHHIEQLLSELRTNHVDDLVVHPVADPAEQARQEKLAIGWQSQGLVRRLGTWMPSLDADAGPYAFAVAPCNIITTDAPERFAAYKAKGWETLATSPFVRGWELDKRAAGQDKRAIAETMIRLAAFTPNVDRLIVAMRKTQWISANLASIAKGPL